MDASHRASRQGCVGLFLEALHSPAGLGIIVHLLDLDSGEPLEFHSSDSRYDVVFDHVLISLCGVGADHRLAVGFKPQPAPLRHSIVTALSIKRKCWRTMRKPTVLRIASTSQMMVGLVEVLTVQAGSA